MNLGESTSRLSTGTSARDARHDAALSGSDAQVTCPNCGAGFSDLEARCPYCGTFNPNGAEIAYMQELENIKEVTDDLDDDVQGNLKASFQGNAKRIIRLIAIIVAVILAFILVNTFINKNDEQQKVRGFQARESFREQYFPEFDRLYESGDDAALSEYVWSLMDDPGFDALYSWKHAGYLEAYNDWEALKVSESEMQKGAFRIDDYTWSVSVAIRLAYPNVNTGYQINQLTDEEEARAAPYRAYALQFLQNTLQMNEGEIKSFVDACTDEHGDIMDNELKSALTQRLGELGTL
ncbi:MAG: hypothetical protein IJH88_08155 [Eggerthellaceae bacterium]|nr:hypothetical protein [Eggerthellaceae bacterium]